jgi:hypothetical protein
MTEPLDSPGQIASDQSEHVAVDPNLQRKGRFSPLFVVLTFVCALFLGAAIGYGLGRSQSGPPVRIVVTATPGEAVAQTDGTQARPTEEPEPATEADSTAAAATPTIMDFVLSDARHFQGEAGAPITVVEFSDFK